MQGSPALTLADVILPRLDSDGRWVMIARDIALMLAFAAFLAVFAQIQIRLPWTTVPITGQTFAVLVTGASLGAWRGAGSVIFYTLLGMFLLPVFTPAVPPTSGAWDLHFVLPWRGNERVLWELSSGGFIAGFILAAGLVGYLAERGWDRGQWANVALLAGNLLLYVPGLLWLGYLIGTDWVAPGGSRAISEVIPGSSTVEKTLNGGLYPFVVGDLMKLLLASMVLPSAWLLVEKLGRRRP